MNLVNLLCIFLKIAIYRQTNANDYITTVVKCVELYFGLVYWISKYFFFLTKRLPWNIDILSVINICLSDQISDSLLWHMYDKRLTLVTTTCVTHKLLFRNSRHCEGGKIMIQKIKNPRKKVARRPHLGNCAFHEEKPSFHTWAYVHVLHQPSCRDLRYITTITTHAPPPSEEITGQPPIQSSGEPQADHRKGMCINCYRYTGCLYVAECL